MPFQYLYLPAQSVGLARDKTSPLISANTGDLTDLILAITLPSLIISGYLGGYYHYIMICNIMTVRNCLYTEDFIDIHTFILSDRLVVIFSYQ